MASNQPEDYFSFPVGTCLEAGQAALVFATYAGGGDFGGAIAFQTPNETLGLNNNGDTVTVTLNGLQIDSVTYTKTEADYDQSMTREVALDGTAPMVRHSELGGAGMNCPAAPGTNFEVCSANVSPGRCTSGSAFPDCSVDIGPGPDAEGDGMNADDTSHGDGVDADGPACDASPLPGDLRINEIMSDPNGVDHNGDGVAAALEDEYVEIVNLTGGSLDLSRVELVTGGQTGSPVKHLLDINGCLESHHGLLIFGGGTPALSIEGAVVRAMPSSISLNNEGGDSVALVDLDGIVIDEHIYSELSGESWVRYPDGTGDFLSHSAAAAEALVEPVTTYSPGKCVDGSQIPYCL